MGIQMQNILDVQMAKSICMESKKKNITNNDIDAPNGRHRACMVSNVCTSNSREEKEKQSIAQISQTIDGLQYGQYLLSNLLF